MQKISKLFVTAALGLIAATGCGGDDDSGVPGSTKLGDITDSDANALCEEFTAKTKELLSSSQERLCTAFGVQAAASGGDCEQVKKGCLEQDAEQQDAQDQCTANDVQSLDCPDLTVGEWRACMDAAIQTSADAPKVSCDSSMEDLNAASMSETELPKACQSVFDKCPTLLQQISSGSDSASG